MSIDLILSGIAIFLGVSTVAALAALADRTARSAAWRQIALERRWNDEQRQRRGYGVRTPSPWQDRT